MEYIADGVHKQTIVTIIDKDKIDTQKKAIFTYTKALGFGAQTLVEIPGGYGQGRHILLAIMREKTARHFLMLIQVNNL